MPTVPARNPPHNHFCGSCGASLEASSDLLVRRENGLTIMGHTLPAKLGPAGDVLVVGLATLAAQAGLSWLRQKIKAEDPPLTLTTLEHDTAASEGLLGRGLEEILIQELEEDYRSRTFAWQAIRSIVVTEWTFSRRRSAGGPRGRGRAAVLELVRLSSNRNARITGRDRERAEESRPDNH